MSTTAPSPNHLPPPPASAAASSLFPVLTDAQVLERFKAKRSQLPFYSFYNSYLGGIVTDPSLMLIPLDDHMCHRGHAVFDTAAVEKGHLYRADIHIARLLRSAEAAKIQHPFTAVFIKDAIKATATAGRNGTCSIRMWITAGPGDFSYAPAGCTEACLYVIAFAWFPMPAITNALHERTVPTSRIALRGAPIGTMKSSNYLANVLLHLDAKERGGVFGLWVEEPAPEQAVVGASGSGEGVRPPQEGGVVVASRRATVKEGPVNSIVIVRKDGSVATPPAHDILLSCTAKRVLEILAAEGRRAEYEVLTVGDVLDAAEAFFVGGDTHVMPIGHLDGAPIGSGMSGPIAIRVHDTLEREAGTGAAYSERFM